MIRSVYDEIEILRNFASLYDDWSNITLEEENEFAHLQATKTNLFNLLSKSICECPLCTQTDKDMVYIDLYETWYCVECQEKDRVWYHPMGSEEDRRQNTVASCYRNMSSKKIVI